MITFKKAAVVGLILVTAACTNPDRFGAGAGGGAGAAGGGAAAGTLSPAQDPSSPVYFSQTVGDRVLFAVDQSTLSAAGQQTLMGQAAWLNQNQDH